MNQFETQLADISNTLFESVVNDYDSSTALHQPIVKDHVRNLGENLMDITDNEEEYALTYAYYFATEQFFQHSSNSSGKKLQAALLFLSLVWGKFILSYDNELIQFVGHKIDNPEFAEEDLEDRAKVENWISYEMNNSMRTLQASFPDLYRRLLE